MKSEVLLDNENKRIDSEYFRKQFLEFFKNVPNLKPLEYFVKEGYRVVYENTEIISKEEGQNNNLPYFLQASDLSTPYIKTDNLYYVDEKEWIRYPKGRIIKGEILIEVKGKIDKVAIVADDFHEKTLVSGSIFKLTVNEKISKHVLLCYLISKYGVAFKDRFKTNLLISYVSKPDLYRIPVPNFQKEFQDKIDTVFKIIFKSQKNSRAIYSQAETILLQEIGLEEKVTSLNPVEVTKQTVEGSNPSEISNNNAEKMGFLATNINMKSFKESFGVTGRLDAEYYQKKYENFEKSILENQNGFTYIKSEFEHIKTNLKKEESGYNYIEIGDINVSDGSCKSNYVETIDLPANAKTLVEKGDILISNVRPYRGAITLIDFDQENLIVSGAFTVLREKRNSQFSNEVLKVLLRTSMYKEWLLKFNVGTSYPVIKDEDVLQLPIPIISKETQKTITNKIQQSQILKKQSEHLLEVAKRAVEIAIEENEQVAIRYIDDKSF